MSTQATSSIDRFNKGDYNDDDDTTKSLLLVCMNDMLGENFSEFNFETGLIIKEELSFVLNNFECFTFMENKNVAEEILFSVMTYDSSLLNNNGEGEKIANLKNVILTKRKSILPDIWRICQVVQERRKIIATLQADYEGEISRLCEEKRKLEEFSKNSMSALYLKLTTKQ